MSFFILLAAVLVWGAGEACDDGRRDNGRRDEGRRDEGRVVAVESRDKADAVGRMGRRRWAPLQSQTQQGE